MSTWIPSYSKCHLIDDILKSTNIFIFWSFSDVYGAILSKTIDQLFARILHCLPATGGFIWIFFPYLQKLLLNATECEQFLKIFSQEGGGHVSTYINGVLTMHDRCYSQYYSKELKFYQNLHLDIFSQTYIKAYTPRKIYSRVGFTWRIFHWMMSTKTSQKISTFYIFPQEDGVHVFAKNSNLYLRNIETFSSNSSKQKLFAK